MPRLDHSALSDLFSDVYERHITRVDSPLGQEVVFEIDHKDGNQYRLEVKFDGGIYVHFTDEGGDWKEIHSA